MLEFVKARTGAVASIAKSWARQAPATALAWVSSLEGKERNMQITR